MGLLVLLSAPRELPVATLVEGLLSLLAPLAAVRPAGLAPVLLLLASPTSARFLLALLVSLVQPPVLLGVLRVQVLLGLLASLLVPLSARLLGLSLGLLCLLPGLLASLLLGLVGLLGLPVSLLGLLVPLLLGLLVPSALLPSLIHLPT